MKRSTSRLHRSSSRRDDDANRPALTPISTVLDTDTPVSMQSQSSRLRVLDSMKGYSAVSDNPFFGEDSEFELMHIKITVFGLSGLLIEKHQKKSADANANKKGVDGAAVRGLSSESTISSCEEKYHGAQEPVEDPVYAVVTHKRNVSNSATSIASHLPSLPLGSSLSSFGQIYRHAASWSANAAPLIIDEDDECSLFDQSSFIMERVMMREPYDRQRNAGATVISNFVHETVDLAINLKRGNEMIPLGITSLVISGDEEGPLKMNLPAKEVIFKGKKVVLSDTKDGKKAGKKKNRRLFAKNTDKPYFPSDKSKEYSLDENATLKIALQVIPHSSFKETEVAKVKHADKKSRRREKAERERAQDEASMHHYQERLQARLNGMNLGTPRSLATSNATSGKTSNPSSVSQFLCAPMLCLGADNKAADPKSPAGSREYGGSDFSLDKSTMDTYLRERGVYDDSSILSSVSESDSDSEDGDPVHLLDTDIVVRKRTFA